MNGTYVSDISHYLDDSGDLAAEMPAEARQLASFLTLLIDEASRSLPVRDYDSRIRCRTVACPGSILVTLPSRKDAISWQCPICGHNGVINNWQATRWNRSEDQVP